MKPTGRRDLAALATAIALRERREAAAALAVLDGLVAADPAWAAPLCEAGRCLGQLGHDEPALKALVRAATLAPEDAAMHYHLGVAQRKLNDRAGAKASYERTLELDPGFANAWYRLGNLSFEANAPREALDQYDRAIRCDDRLPAFHFNRGVVLKALGQDLDAIDAYDWTLQRDPRHLDACFNRANTLAGLGRLDEALAGFDAALRLKADHPPSRFNRALALLLNGDLVAGFADYGWRRQANGTAQAPRAFVGQHWSGSQPLAGRTLLVHAEQGLGDFIQFCRYAAPLRDLGARVLLETPPGLLGVMQSLDGPAQLLAANAGLPAFDYHCSVMDLPGALGTRLDAIPARTPYLEVSAADLVRWESRLGAARRFRVGLAWSGARGHRNDAARSMGAVLLAPLFGLPIEFHCLQQEVRAEDEATLAGLPRLIRHEAELGDFSDTAALASLMDLVISVDTSVAHLAAALGRPVWLLLPKVPDWRWLLDRSDSPWYPTMRLFRQTTAGDWPDVLAEVMRALPGLLPDSP